MSHTEWDRALSPPCSSELGEGLQETRSPGSNALVPS